MKAHFGDRVHAGYRKLNVLSLDVVLGALAGAVFAVHMTGARPDMAFWYCLGTAVWLVYTTDHLIDGLRSGFMARSPSHHFHFKYRRALAVVILLVGLATGLIAFVFLPGPAILFGTALGLFVIVYLLVSFIPQKKARPYLFKEFIIAMVYVTGIWGIPVIQQWDYLGPEVPILMSMNLLLALNNLMTLSYFDEQIDRHEGQASFTTRFGKKYTRTWIYLDLSVILITGTVVIVFFPGMELLMGCQVFMLMALLQLVIFLSGKDAADPTLYRQAGELVFLLPALALFLPG